MAERRSWIIDQYYSATSDAFARRDQTYRVLLQGKLEDEAPETKEEIALQEYYDGLDQAQTQGGNFVPERWNAILERLERKWAREGTLEYVRSETHTEKVPDSLLRVLPATTQRRILLSEQARERYARRLNIERVRNGQRQPLNNRSQQRSSEPARGTRGNPIEARRNR